jgi:hypothetical protein
MTKTPDKSANQPAAAAPRGQDDRRSGVNPADNPAPHSPEADAEAVRKGEENLDRVTSK